MRINRISMSLRYLVLLGTCLSAHGGIRYAPVIPPPTIQFGNLVLKSPPAFGILKSPLSPYVHHKDTLKQADKEDDSYKAGEEDVGSEYDDSSSEPSSDYRHHHHPKKHTHVVLHKHVHKGHVIHDHKHEGEGKHLHKHAGHEQHEHHHHGEGHHEHKHLGKAEHEHKHEGAAEHNHKHKGEAEHKHEHLGAGKHLHKHSGHSEHGHKHEGWADHGHKHKGEYEHGHHHKGAGKHDHKHWGEADHKHKHEGDGKHKHSHYGHGIFSHEHEGNAKHKHSHYGDGHHDHKHGGKAHHSHQHNGHYEAQHKHQGAGYLTFYDDHSSLGDEDYKTELIDIAPKKKKTHKITKEVAYIDPSEFDDFIASLKQSVSHKETKPVYFDDDFDVSPKKKNKKVKTNVPSYEGFENIKGNNFIPKYKETSSYQPFSEEYLKFLSRYVPLKSYNPELPYKHSFSGIKPKKNKYEVSEKVQDIPRFATHKKTKAVEGSEDEEESDPSLIQYNVVHGKESDIFPSMSYVSTVRNAR